MAAGENPAAFFGPLKNLQKSKTGSASTMTQVIAGEKRTC
jgi:hypothetical protein